jgi:hypothetical protein
MTTAFAPRPSPGHGLPRGPYNFHGSREEVEREHASLLALLPSPMVIQVAREHATPVGGFLVRRSRVLERLEELFAELFRALERAQVLARREPGNHEARVDLESAWSRYRSALVSLLDNVLGSDYGRGFPQVFWLHHSNAVVRVLAGTPRRLRELDASLARERGEAMRYSLLALYLDRLFDVVFERVDHFAESTGQKELRVAPQLLVRMRDNVLIWSEDHVGRDLAELAGYFRGCLRVDASDFLYRFALVRRRHGELLARDRQLRAAAELWSGAPEAPPAAPGAPSGAEAASDPDRLLLRPGYLSYLAAHPAFAAERLLSPAEVRLWEGLLGKLKEFEILNAARRLIVEVDVDAAGVVRCDDRAARRLGLSGAVAFAPDTHPLDFGAAWVVDPEVSRAGLVYDITDFSSVVSRIGLADREAQQRAFQQMFLLQHDFNLLAANLGLRREKYLGDGAFYSGRRPDRALLLALLLQRRYRRAIGEGLPFDRGMRIALNFSSYRLMPFAGTGGESGRHEVFGHGVVELSRLVSGKRGLDLEEIMVTLKANGYDDQSIHEFFAPLLQGEAGASDRRPQTRFSARVTANGTLVNEGIVATAGFLQRMSQQALGPIYLHRAEDRTWAAVHLVDERGARHVAGLRRLGVVDLKGLDRIGVYEVFDGQGWVLRDVLPQRNLLQATDELYASRLTGR